MRNPMQNQPDSTKVLPVANSALMGAGAVLIPVATGMPYSPALADALAMRSDQVAVGTDLWRSVAVVGNTPTHPGQGNLFDQN